MPELLEIETYRQQAEKVVGEQIERLDLMDLYYWRSEVDPDVFAGATIEAARRIGKLLILDTTAMSLGLRFGMTGLLLLDGQASLDGLIYSARVDQPQWHRFSLHTTTGRQLTITDPRRLGWVEPEPDEGRLGVDAAVVTIGQLKSVLAGSKAPLKARLMDQQRLAGLGNLLVDEILWRSSLSPARPAGSLEPDEVRRLRRHLRRVLAQLGERGGSHTGDLQEHRTRGGLCPRDGAPLRRDTIGGRTTYWCPEHQR